MRIDTKFMAFTIALLLLMGGLPSQAAEKSGSDSSNLHSEFMQAVVNGEVDKVERFVDRGIDINERNEVGATALMWAIMKKQPDVARLLIKNGADLNARTDAGITALMVAVSEREPDMVRLLVSAGADSKIKDQKGRTALDYARDQNDRSIVQILAQNEEGATGKFAESRGEMTRTNESKSDESGIQAVVTGVDKPDNCLRIRKGPGRNFDKVGCLSFGDKVSLSGVTQDIWAQLEEPQKGWVSASQLKTEDGSVLGKKADSGKKSVKSQKGKIEADSRTVEIETPYAHVQADPETGGSVQLNTPVFSGQIDLGRVPGPFAPRAGALPAPPAGLPAPPPLFR